MDDCKRCFTCGEMKPLDQFFMRSHKSGKRRGVCKKCCAANARRLAQERFIRNPEKERAKRREYHRRTLAKGITPQRKLQKRQYYLRKNKGKEYGFTYEMYLAMLEKQGGVCAICKKPETAKNQKGQIRMLAIDHDHTTGKVRGLLCFRCNTNLGILENETFMAAVQAYLTAAAINDVG